MTIIKYIHIYCLFVRVYFCYHSVSWHINRWCYNRPWVHHTSLWRYMGCNDKLWSGSLYSNSHRTIYHARASKLYFNRITLLPVIIWLSLKNSWNWICVVPLFRSHHSGIEDDPDLSNIFSKLATRTCKPQNFWSLKILIFRFARSYWTHVWPPIVRWEDLGVTIWPLCWYVFSTANHIVI